MSNNHAFYPLAVGNTWTYIQKDGSTFTNQVTSIDPSMDNQFIMVNSMIKKDQRIRKEGSAYVTDSFEEGNFQILLKDDLSAGDSWDIKFKANGLESILTMTVKATGLTCDVEGKTYNEVMQIEAESKIVMNGTVMPLNFFTQYFYARGIGLILTTSSAGDRMALKEYAIKT